MRPIIEKIKDWWRSADRTQKIVTLGGGGLLVAVATGAFIIASQPRMAPVYPGTPAAQQAGIRDELLSLGYPVDVNQKGDVLAPVDKLPEIHMQLEQAGKAPVASSRGIDWLSQTSPFTSPGQERERIKAAREGELAASIETLDSVRAARVHINFGKESPFATEGAPPTAVINITEDGSKRVSTEEAAAIARLVQNAVPGLESEGVTVITSDGRMAFDGEAMAEGSFEGTRKIDMEFAESQRREKDLQRRLDQAFGPGATIATVGVELDLDEVRTETTSETPTRQPIARNTMTETLEGGPAGSSGVSGISSNLPEALGEAQNGGEGSTGYSSEVRQEEFGRANESTLSVKAPGSVKTMTLNVLVDSEVIADPAPVQQFLDGLLAARGEREFQATVTSAPFSKAAQEAAKSAEAAASQQAILQQVISMLPAIALVILGFILIKAMRGKSSSNASGPEAALPGGGSMPFPQMPMPQPGMPVNPQDYAAYYAQQAAVSDNPLLAAAQAQQDAVMMQARALEAPVNDGDSAAALLQAMAKQQSGSDEEDAPYWAFEEDEQGEIQFKEIREKVDVPLEQIRSLAKTRPETVAQLLKSWMMEDR
jgi:flagellar M-ring protein FliF